MDKNPSTLKAAQPGAKPAPQFPTLGIVCMLVGGLFLRQAGFWFGNVLLGLGAGWLVIALVIKARR